MSVKIAVSLYDKNQVLVETRTVSPEDAGRIAHDFALLHGSDPEEDGAGASRGSIVFEPVFTHQYTFADLARDIAAMTPEQRACQVMYEEPFDRPDHLSLSGLHIAEVDLLELDGSADDIRVGKGEPFLA